MKIRLYFGMFLWVLLPLFAHPLLAQPTDPNIGTKHVDSGLHISATNVEIGTAFELMAKDQSYAQIAATDSLELVAASGDSVRVIIGGILADSTYYEEKVRCLGVDTVRTTKKFMFIESVRIDSGLVLTGTLNVNRATGNTHITSIAAGLTNDAVAHYFPSRNERAYVESWQVSSPLKDVLIANNRDTLNTTSSPVVAARVTRTSVQVFNADGVDTVYVGTGTATKGAGYMILPGTSVRINTPNAINGVAFGASGDSVAAITYLEEYDNTVTFELRWYYDWRASRGTAGTTAYRVLDTISLPAGLVQSPTSVLDLLLENRQDRYTKGKGYLAVYAKGAAASADGTVRLRVAQYGTRGTSGF